jgi:predicted phosphodiesterase
MRWIRKDLRIAENCVYLIPLGDFHVGAEEFTAASEKKLKGYIDWILARDNAWAVLMGDLTNCSTVVSAGRPFEEKLDGTDQFLEVKRILEPLAKEKRILSSVVGNHEYQYMKAIGSRVNRNKELCALLDIDYSGAQAYVSLNITWGKSPHRITYDIFATHGYGGGRKKGAKVNNLAGLAEIASADLYLMGHTHECFGYLTTKWAHVQNRLVEKKIGFCITGSFLSYAQESEFVASESYAERMALPPARIGAPRIRLECAEGRKDIHISI